MSDDPVIHERVVREILSWMSGADFTASPPSFAQRIHERLRRVTADSDPYEEAKRRHNEMALRLLPELRTEVQTSSHPLETATRLAIAGNTVDLGVHAEVGESDLREAVNKALKQSLGGDPEAFSDAVRSTKTILYLADNAGEIALDRLLIEQLGPERVVLAVRGGPVINDATIADAHAVGLDEMVEVIDNGSDAPGTILEDCSEDFRLRFAEAGLVVAKGQGNYESLSDTGGNIFFLFKVKCPVVADRIGLPVGTHVVSRS